jgi:hypothetical protein
MAINYGTLFTRLGNIFSAADVVFSHVGSAQGGKVDTIAAGYASSLQDVLDGNDPYPNLESHRANGESYASTLGSLAADVVVRTVQDERRLADDSLGTALAFLVADMEANSESVKASVPAASVTAGASNIGDTKLVVSVKRNDGRDCENAFPETLSASVVSDSFTGGVSAFSERITVLGAEASPSRNSWRWPQGSGVSVSLTAVDSALDAQGGYLNLLTNGDFEDFTTPNVPDRWTIRTGVAGTEVKSTTSFFGGAKAVEFAGAATNTAIDQEFNSGSGTSATLAPLRTYMIHLWAKTTNTPVAGTLQVALVDGSGNVVNDEEGVPNSATVDLTTLGTTYAAKNFVVRTPRNLPSVLRLRLRLSTALSVGTSLYVDNVCFARATQLYADGPFVCAFSGATKPVTGDSWTIAATVGTVGKHQRAFNRWFGMDSLGLLLPSVTGGGETRADYS